MEEGGGVAMEQGALGSNGGCGVGPQRLRIIFGGHVVVLIARRRPALFSIGQGLPRLHLPKGYNQNEVKQTASDNLLVLGISRA
uniref:Uncharacterized protein n=1 Tax=Oryza nivara TaxID=4536 RepID=A0A0E0G8L0_ORYNI